MRENNTREYEIQRVREHESIRECEREYERMSENTREYGTAIIREIIQRIVLRIDHNMIICKKTSDVLH